MKKDDRRRRRRRTRTEEKRKKKKKNGAFEIGSRVGAEARTRRERERQRDRERKRERSEKRKKSVHGDGQRARGWTLTLRPLSSILVPRLGSAPLSPTHGAQRLLVGPQRGRNSGAGEWGGWGPRWAAWSGGGGAEGVTSWPAGVPGPWEHHL